MKLRRLGFTLAVATAFAGGMLVQTESGQAKSTQEISLYANSELSSLDPAKVTETNAFTQLDNVGEGLYTYDKNGKPHKALAKKVKISKDQKKYTIDIRKNTKWSNGSTVTAADFVYAWQRAVDPKTASEYAYLFDNIVNSKGIQKGKLAPKELGVKATGKYQLTIKLVKPQTYFKMILARETLYPLNKKFVTKQGKAYGTSSKKTLYNGPFVSSGWKGTNLRWKLKKNPHYWDKKHVKLAQINYSVIKEPSTAYNLYQTKKLDQITLVGEQAQQLAHHPDLVKRSLAATSYLQYNLKNNSGLENQKVRQAISLAINRQQISNKILKNGAKPAENFVPRKVAANPKTKQDFYAEAKVKNTASYKPKLAKQLFTQGLKELGKTQLELRLVTADTDTSKQVADFLQSQLETNLPGLKVELHKVPQNSRIAAVNKGDFDMSFQGWSADFADPYTFLQIFPSDSAQNHTGWSKQKYDQAITDSLNKDAAAPQKRWADLIKANQILMKEQVVTPVYQNNNEDLVNPRLKGVNYNRINGHYMYKKAYLVKK